MDKELKEREKRDVRKFVIIVAALVLGLAAGFVLLGWAFFMDATTGSEEPTPPDFVDPDDPFDRQRFQEDGKADDAIHPLPMNAANKPLSPALAHPA